MHDKQGFTLLEMMVCMMIISVMGMFSLKYLRPVSFDAEMFVLDSLHAQILAMKERNDVQGMYCSYDLYGHPSSAGSIVFGQKRVIVHLGWGRLSVR